MSGDRRAQGAAPVAVRVDVLGPLVMAVDGHVVDVPGPKRRAVLAVLTMADGRAVSVDDLLDAIWPSGAPDTGRATLHSHISRLRGHLGAGAGRLAGLEHGYRLDLDDDAVDARRAAALLDAASVRQTSDVEGAFRLLGEARSLWRGPPLSDLQDVAPLAAWTVALDELRRDVDETLVSVALDCGRTAEVLEVARTLVAADPLRESGVVLLMRALAQSGRAPEALRAGYEFHRRLRAETGLAPSAALNELERTIAEATGGGVAGVPPRIQPLYGRDADLVALGELLTSERLVTILGSAGVGKTTLALEAARRTDPAILLSLASVTDPSAISHALAAALDLHVMRGDVLSACSALLAAGPALLVVDNCEHVLTGAGQVVSALVDSCPELTVLATSREPLGLAFESRFRIGPLSLPDLDVASEPDRSPAVACFLDRARHVQSSLGPTPDDLVAVADIVRRLDGLPLAIELAAGMLSAIDLPALHRRVDDALDLRVSTNAGGRHTDLRHAIRWSYDLLAGDEQRLFCHLAVYPDGFDLETVEATATDLGITRPVGVLTRLVDSSMIEAQRDGGTRYRMLDTLRAFARDQLATTGRHSVAAERLRRWARDLVAWADVAIATDDEPTANDRVRGELGNLRAAWRHVRDGEHLDDAVAIVLGLADVAGWRDLTEVWEWTLELAADPAIETHPRAAAVLGAAASSAWSRSELDDTERLARRGLELAVDAEGRSHCLGARALAALGRGRLDDAAADADAAAALAVRPDQNLGIVALARAYAGRLDDARDALARSETMPASLTVRAWNDYVAGEIESIAGNSDRAEQRYSDAITQSRRTGATLVESVASVGLLSLRVAEGRVADALVGYRDVIDYWDRTHAWVQQWTTLRNLARLLRDLGDDAAADFLEVAADLAPDAPPAERERVAPHKRTARLVADASTASRYGVLERARAAVDSHLVRLREGAGRP